MQIFLKRKINIWINTIMFGISDKKNTEVYLSKKIIIHYDQIDDTN